MNGSLEAGQDGNEAMTAKTNYYRVVATRFQLQKVKLAKLAAQHHAMRRRPPSEVAKHRLDELHGMLDEMGHLLEELGCAGDAEWAAVQRQLDGVLAAFETLAENGLDDSDPRGIRSTSPWPTLPDPDLRADHD